MKFRTDKKIMGGGVEAQRRCRGGWTNFKTRESFKAKNSTKRKELECGQNGKIMYFHLLSLLLYLPTLSLSFQSNLKFSLLSFLSTKSTLHWKVSCGHFFLFNFLILFFFKKTFVNVLYFCYVTIFSRQHQDYKNYLTFQYLPISSRNDATGH